MTTRPCSPWPSWPARRGDASAEAGYRQRAAPGPVAEGEAMTTEGPAEVDDCWNRIGVGGDRSCPELAVHVHCRNCPVFASAARGFFHRRAPEGYLEEWADFLVQAGRPGRSADEANLLVFRLGEEWLAVALGVVAEVTTTRPVHRVPHRTNRVFTGPDQPPGPVAALRLAPRPARRRPGPSRERSHHVRQAGRPPPGGRGLGVRGGRGRRGPAGPCQ